MDPSPLLEARLLTRRYAHRRAVSAVSFDLHRGEVLGLLGLNGAGKSTTLQMLCGVLQPDEGSVRVAGHDLAREPLAAKRHLGYLPQIPPLFPDATVAEFLGFCAALRGLPRARQPAAVRSVLARCALEDVRDRLIRNLSGGYRQRVGIAQSLVHDPAVVVLDEPTNGLDPAQLVEVRTLIRALGETHAVLLSTHLLAEVATLCQRVIVLHEGQLVREEKLEAPAVEVAARLEALLTDLGRSATEPGAVIP